MPRRTPTPSMEVPDDVAGADVSDQTETDNGVNQPPYQANWITIKDAAARAGVTGQTIRNAYENHEAFNFATAADESGAVSTSPAWFRTKMVDQFGNTTDYDVVYVDADAVQRWIEARASKPAINRSPDAPKRYIVRLTDDQVQQLQTLLSGAEGFENVTIEKPPQARRKSKADAGTTETANDHADEPMPADQGTSLFDVDLIEE